MELTTIEGTYSTSELSVIRLQTLEELAGYLKSFLPPDLGRMENIQQAFALSALSKAISTIEAYLLLVRAGYWEEGRILARTIVEVVINCLWVQKNEKEQLRRIGSLIVSQEEAKIKRVKNFLDFEQTSLPAGQVSTSTMKNVLKQKEDFVRGMHKSFAKQFGINSDYVKKVGRTRMEDKIAELQISPHYLDVYSSASDAVHAGTAALEAYTKNPSGQRSYDGAFSYDAYTIDAIHTLLIEAACHTVDVYPLFRGSAFITTIEQHKTMRDEIMSRCFELSKETP